MPPLNYNNHTYLCAWFRNFSIACIGIRVRNLIPTGTSRRARSIKFCIGEIPVGSGAIQHLRPRLRASWDLIVRSANTDTSTVSTDWTGSHRSNADSPPSSSPGGCRMEIQATIRVDCRSTIRRRTKCACATACTVRCHISDRNEEGGDMG